MEQRNEKLQKFFAKTTKNRLHILTLNKLIKSSQCCDLHSENKKLVKSL